MKITQEVREFAAQQNTPADKFLTADSDAAAGADAARSTFANPAATVEAEKGMAAMSETFREKGAEIYLPAERQLCFAIPFALNVFQNSYYI